MFAGKTTELLRRLRRYEIAKRRCKLITSTKNTRAGPGLLDTHGGEQHDCDKCTSLSELECVLDDYDVIAVDEGQFFEDLAPMCSAFADEGKIVLVASLVAWTGRVPCESVSQLIPLCEFVDKLTAICPKCGNDASFTTRRSEHGDSVISRRQPNTASEEDKGLIRIGGADVYETLCRACLISHEQGVNWSDDG